jgi:HAD superfamily hydrolase (TIGR01484 family)
MPPRSALQPLSTWPLAARRQILGVFTDIDDTLTEHGRISPAARQALSDLHAAGLQVITITGRPIGWCGQFLSGEQGPPWPVDAMVAENGALAWLCQGRATPEKCYQQDAAERQANQARMQQVAARILREVPGAMISRDSGGRETDLSIDHGEYCQLSPERIAEVVAIMQSEGMHTSVSSIHIHGCFGAFDKWQGANWLLRTLYGRPLKDELDRWVFVGDSGNDQAMFQHFIHSVGVANIRRCADQLQYLPRYITPSAHGAGFAEVATALLQARQA